MVSDRQLVVNLHFWSHPDSCFGMCIFPKQGPKKPCTVPFQSKSWDVKADTISGDSIFDSADCSTSIRLDHLCIELSPLFPCSKLFQRNQMMQAARHTLNHVSSVSLHMSNWYNDLIQSGMTTAFSPTDDAMKLECHKEARGSCIPNSLQSGRHGMKASERRRSCHHAHNRAGKPSLLGCPIWLMLADTYTFCTTFCVCIVISPAIYSRLSVVRWCLSPSGVCAGLPLMYLEYSWARYLPQAINDDHWLIHVKWSSLKMVMESCWDTCRSSEAKLLVIGVTNCRCKPWWLGCIVCVHMSMRISFTSKSLG